MICPQFEVPGWPRWGGPVYLCWEAPIMCRFSLTYYHEGEKPTAAGKIWLPAADGMSVRRKAPVAYSQEQVDWYITHGVIYRGILDAKMAEARREFQSTAGQPFPQDPYLGVIHGSPHPYLDESVEFLALNYPDYAAVGKVLALSPYTVRVDFASGDGWRVMKSPRVVGGGEVKAFERQREVWVPLFNAAKQAADEEFAAQYPNPY